MGDVCGDSSTALQTVSPDGQHEQSGPPVYCQVSHCAEKPVLKTPKHLEIT